MERSNEARGIEHVGVTVADIEGATRYFEEAFGASVLYDHLPLGAEPYGGQDAERLLGVAPGTAVLGARMLCLPDGPNIELFEYEADEQRRPARPSDLGVQHVAFYTDDIEASCSRVVAAGGEVLVGPQEFQLELEAGPGNQWCYTRAPWGMTIELTTFPSTQGYERDTEARRWRPARREHGSG